jgi:PadR family transcriptional regulator PadR
LTFQLGSALLDACVLATLNREDTYGYVLTQSVKAVVEISESTLYPVLRRLQKEGWLTTYDQPYSGRLRRYYAITDAGRKALARYRAEWDIYKKQVESMLFGG